MLQNQNHLFNLPQDITYLNCGYMSPMLKSVAEVGVRSVYGKEDPTTIKPEDFFRNTALLRAEFAKLIDVKNENLCAIMPSASYGMANVAKNIQVEKGDNIIIPEGQFPSNVYAWKELEREKGVKLRIVNAPETAENRGKIWNERILEAINSQTKMVAIGHIHWADGTKFDLKKIRERSREVGALLVIDGTQSIGALPFSVVEFEPDAVVTSGYKWLMGPYATGMAYFGEYFQNGKPIENNWINRLDSQNFANLVNYQDEYQPGAIRYEVGESANFILTPMLTEALRQVNAWGPENIQSYCRSIAHEAQAELSHMGFQIESAYFRSEHLFGIRLPKGLDLDVVKNRLAADKIFVSVRGNSIRVSPHVYNTKADFDCLLHSLKQV
ncbi:aminotransferase class V-fold PLP-dependent enzyme [Roseivirga echinicomitans]